MQKPLSMMISWAWILALATVLAGPSTAAAETSVGSKSKTMENPGMSNESLDQTRGSLDARLSARQARIKQNTEKLHAFQTRMGRERMDFEEQMAQEQKAFYTYMKSMKPEERKDAMEYFLNKQKKKRLQFDKDQMQAQKKWFNAEIEDNWKSEDLDMEKTAAAEAQSEYTSPSESSDLFSAPAPKPKAQ